MITANTWFGRMWERWRDQTVLPEMAKRKLPYPEADSGPPLRAIVNHGRWIVICECGGAEYAWEEGWFMCLSCFNAAHGHRLRKAVFPRVRRAIEAELLKRPLPNRNWNGESITRLREENQQHFAELIGA